MFAPRYFPLRYFPARYWPVGGTAAATVITIKPQTGEFIDGATTRTLTTQFDAVHIFCDGFDWWVLSDLQEKIVPKKYRAKEVERPSVIKKAGGKKAYKRKKSTVPKGVEKMLKGLGRISRKKKKQLAVK